MRKGMRRFILVVSTIYMYSSLISCNDRKVEEEEVRDIKIGISIYEQDDIFISSIISNIENITKEKRNEGSYNITLNVEDAKSNQYNQNEQVDMFIDQGYDVMCINLVDRRSAANIINKAKNANIPVIFFNREPVEEDINLWNKVYYVGAKAEMSGYMQGKIVLDEYNKDNMSVDKNNDGKLQYVMLEGEPEHQDSLIRTESTIKKITSVGIEVEKLASDSANWQNSQAYEKTSQWINEFGDKIEVVFSNNDDMALGAIHAFENSNISLENRPIIVGIDGIPEALTAIKNGSMKGTVFNDYITQAKEMIDICYDLKYDENSKLIREINNTKSFKTSYKKITNDNVENYINNENLY